MSYEVNRSALCACQLAIRRTAHQPRKVWDESESEIDYPPLWCCWSSYIRHIYYGKLYEKEHAFRIVIWHLRFVCVSFFVSFDSFGFIGPGFTSTAYVCIFMQRAATKTLLLGTTPYERCFVHIKQSHGILYYAIYIQRGFVATVFHIDTALHIYAFVDSLQNCIARWCEQKKSTSQL